MSASYIIEFIKRVGKCIFFLFNVRFFCHKAQKLFFNRMFPGHILLVYIIH